MDIVILVEYHDIAKMEKKQIQKSFTDEGDVEKFFTKVHAALYLIKAEIELKIGNGKYQIFKIVVV
jgi:hypothetical protein